MRRIDVFNGDADGLCALQQLRLAHPANSELVTGTKRDIALVSRVRADPGDEVTVMDLSLARNRSAVVALLDRGVRVRYFDHHDPGEPLQHALLEAHIDTSRSTCSSVIMDGVLGGRFRAWAVVAAFGDNLAGTAYRLAAPLGLDPARLDLLRLLGEDLNYNAYGDALGDLIAPPAEVAMAMREYDDPIRFVESSELVPRLNAARRDDTARAHRVMPLHSGNRATVHVLPDEAWSRRVIGTFANELASTDAERAHAVLVQKGETFAVSVRAAAGAYALCRRFGGGGRETAAGIDALPAGLLAEFVESLERMP